MTDGQSASLSWGQAPIWDPRPILLFVWLFHRPLRVCWCGAPSLTRSRAYSFQLLLDIASAVFLGSESHGTHEYILLSLLFCLRQPGEPGSCIYLPLEQGKLKSKLCYDLRSVGQYIAESGSHLEPITRLFSSVLTIAGVLMPGALSDGKTGLQFTPAIASGPCQSSHSRVRVPQNSRPYFTVSFETPNSLFISFRNRVFQVYSRELVFFSSPLTTRRATVEVF
jgi:hypothetical protein